METNKNISESQHESLSDAEQRHEEAKSFTRETVEELYSSAPKSDVKKQR